MKRLNKRQILLLRDQLLTQTGGLRGLRDEGLLESALNAIQIAYLPTVIE